MKGDYTMRFHSNKDFNANLPHSSLRKFVSYYNVVFPKQNMFTEHYTLMPNACGTLSIVFNGNEVIAELWGASISPVMLGREPDRYQVLLLIQLYPCGLYQLTNLHQTEFVDKRIRLKDVDKDLSDSLCQAFETAHDIPELFSMCDRILYSRMGYNVVSGTLLEATNKILNSHGHMSVSEIARMVGYSDRQLNRLFLMQIGMSIKSYARLVRFNYVLRHIHQSQCFFTELAQQAGYFDQQHFDKDFRSISGYSPKTYRQKMSDFYYDETEIFDKIIERKEDLK
jgi:AraC-like DNA-binding protein